MSGRAITSVNIPWDGVSMLRRSVSSCPVKSILNSLCRTVRQEWCAMKPD
jgi:hypothetical protein